MNYEYVYIYIKIIFLKIKNLIRVGIILMEEGFQSTRHGALLINPLKL